MIIVNNKLNTSWRFILYLQEYCYYYWIDYRWLESCHVCMHIDRNDDEFEQKKTKNMIMKIKNKRKTDYKINKLEPEQLKIELCQVVILLLLLMY